VPIDNDALDRPALLFWCRSVADRWISGELVWREQVGLGSRA
jgi:hypothetical protein